MTRDKNRGKQGKLENKERVAFSSTLFSVFAPFFLLFHLFKVVPFPMVQEKDSGWKQDWHDKETNHHHLPTKLYIYICFFF